MFVLDYLFARRRNYKQELCDLYYCEPVTGSGTGEFRSETPAVYFLDRQGKLQLNTIDMG